MSRVSSIRLFSVGLISVLALGSGCAKENSGSPFSSKPTVRAANDIKESFNFIVGANPQTDGQAAPQTRASEESPKPEAPKTSDISFKLDPKTKQAEVAIFKTALEKEFLLQAQIIHQPTVPQWNGLKSRVVAFRQKGTKIYMMEATHGHSVQDDLPQNFILAEFNIKRQAGDQLWFDFNEGMSKIFMVSDWRAQDFEGSDYGATWKSANISMSYLDNASVEQNSLVVSQVAQLSIPQADGSVELSPVATKYYLTPYRPNPNFTPTKSKDFDRLGFFEVAPALTKQGTTVVHATKFDHSSPIVFAVSENTPADYKQAFKDGILYWNKAFGKEVLQVVDAPVGVVGPDFKHNIVQWVNWDTAGFAYADAQSDPRTGEIYHAQVYMTSVFAIWGKVRAQRVIRKLRSRPFSRPIGISLAGFQKNRMCDFHAQQDFISGIETLVASGANDAAILKASQDYVRHVIAHEIGHDLGLRHNFAGSLATNFPLSERTAHEKHYIEKMEAPAGIEVTSSAMEYTRWLESSIHGDQIIKNSSALEYDTKAVKTLYLGKSYDEADLPLFCTDSHAGKYLDCERGDTGKSSIEYVKWNGKDIIENLPKTLIESYLYAKAPLPGVDAVPFKKMTFSPSSLAESILADRGRLATHLTTAGQVLKIHRSFPYVGELNQEEVLSSQLSYLESEVARLGGMDEVFWSIADDFADAEYARFETVLNAGKYDKFMGADGKEYDLTADDKKIMKATVKALYSKLPEAMIKLEAKLLTNTLSKTELLKAAQGLILKPGEIVDHSLADQYAKVLQDRIESVVFATEGTQIVADIEIEVAAALPAAPAGSAAAATPANPATPPKPVKKMVTLKLPIFSYKQELRLETAKLLTAVKAEAPEWALQEKAAVQKQFGELLEKALGKDVPMAKLKLEQLPAPAARWVLENQAIQTVLGGVPKK